MKKSTDSQNSQTFRSCVWMISGWKSKVRLFVSLCGGVQVTVRALAGLVEMTGMVRKVSARRNSPRLVLPTLPSTRPS